VHKVGNKIEWIETNQNVYFVC